MATDDTRDRVIELEAEFRAWKRDAEPRFAKVDEMHAMLLQAKGARWTILGLATLGGFLAGKIGWLVPWMNTLPK